MLHFFPGKNWHREQLVFDVVYQHKLYVKQNCENQSNERRSFKNFFFAPLSDKTIGVKALLQKSRLSEVYLVEVVQILSAK